MRMMKYYFQVVYVPGKELPVADALSRFPLKVCVVDCKVDDLVKAVEEHMEGVRDALPASTDGLARVREATLNDPEMQELLRVMKSGWPNHISQVPSVVRPYWNSKDMLTEIDGVVLRGHQIVIPRTMRPEMIKLARQGHLGIVKTKRRARDSMWWPQMNSQLEQVVFNCLACSREQRREPLCNSPLPARPWEKVGVDLFEVEGMHFLVVVDYYSRYPEVKQLDKSRSCDVILAMKGIFSRFGIPNVVISDNGPQFVSGEFREFSKIYQFVHETSSPKYPWGNGLAERTVGTVKAMIRKAWLAGDDPHLALLAYRSTEHESTGVSPGQLLMGRKLRTTLPMISSQLFPQLVDDSLVEERDRISKLKQAEYYNQRNGVRPLTELQSGDRVLVYDQENKEWNRSGTVGTKVQPRSYQIKTESGWVIRRNRSDIRPHP